MASGYAPRWRRWLHRNAKFLFKRCPDGNYHWFWDRYCFCRCCEHIGDEWHGGTLDFKTGKEIFENVGKQLTR